MPLIRLAVFALLAALVSCATPSREIVHQPGDFAILEVELRG